MLPLEIQPGDYPVDFGRFKLLDLLGRGGFARVFLAEMQGTAGFRKLVALKVIHRHRAEHVADFMREARLSGLLKHR